MFSNGAVFFVFISGYVFQHGSDRYRPAEFFRKKIRNVLVPYLLASAPALIVFTAFARRAGAPAGLYEHPAWEQMVYFLATGSHLTPYWAIPTVAVFFAASPLLYWLDRRSWFYYTLPLLLPLPMLAAHWDPNPLVGFVHYLPAYVLGMACSRYHRAAHAWISRGFRPMIALAALLFLTELLFAPGRYSGYSDMQKLVLALVLLEAFRRWGSRVDHWFALPGTLSLGIYLTHSYLISGARAVIEAVIGGLPAGGWILFTLGTSMVVGSCVAATDFLLRGLGPFSRLIGVRASPEAAVSAKGAALALNREGLGRRTARRDALP